MDNCLQHQNLISDICDFLSVDKPEFIKLLITGADNGNANYISYINLVPAKFMSSCEFTQEDINYYVERVNNAVPSKDKAYSIYFFAVFHIYTIEQFDVNYILSLLKIASDNNIVDAINLLAFMYFNGIGVDKCITSAVKLWEEAVLKNNPKAMCKLANIYFYGKGVTKNTNYAIELLEQSSKMGYLYADKKLGNIYRNMGDNNKAFRFYENASKNGLAEVNNLLGYLYFYGYGIEKDYSKAFELFTSAHNNGITGASFNVAQMYYRGIFVEKSIEDSLYYLKNDTDQSAVILVEKILSELYNSKFENMSNRLIGLLLEIDYTKLRNNNLQKFMIRLHCVFSETIDL